MHLFYELLVLLNCVPIVICNKPLCFGLLFPLLLKMSVSVVSVCLGLRSHARQIFWNCLSARSDKEEPNNESIHFMYKGTIISASIMQKA